MEFASFHRITHVWEKMVLAPYTTYLKSMFLHRIIILEKTDVSYAFDEFQLEIYNRWGELVFKSHTTEPFWDGHMGAEESGDGVFYYIARWSLLCGDTRDYDAAGHFEVLRK